VSTPFVPTDKYIFFVFDLPGFMCNRAAEGSRESVPLPSAAELALVYTQGCK
jgi:hypothetical protein